MTTYRKIKTAKIRGRVWRFLWERIPARQNAWAVIDNGAGTITIDPRIPPGRLLYALIDETFHAHDWTKRNDVVGRFSNDAARIARRVGFRL